MWKPNPTELVGVWELVDVAGQGSLEPMMTAGGADPYFGVQQGVLVSLAYDGSVAVLRYVSWLTNLLYFYELCALFLRPVHPITLYLVY